MKKENFVEPIIVHIWFKEGTTFDTLFSDGKIFRYDIMDKVGEYPIFGELKNRTLFLKGKYNQSGIIWNDKIAISSWTAHEEGIEVNNEYQDYEQYLVGYKLRYARETRNLSQEELEELTGIDQATISKIEKGNMNLSIKTIMKIVKALNATIKFEIK